ncbi:CBS domain-containing protein [Halodesulfovibrio spirochaetisodalis]|uniref:Polya polymerase n=1 Tax=Halodesulfovibrio spirochaetisodalis TaxID=1560234 RepID=A0A1B7X934_9BACT|nr:CBS domain-containing protein [Halodesulfovibrio spirochaetisodalis]OBQ45842.1 polya polymerase [Halodesulfovibrio spirochaetisodalis]
MTATQKKLIPAPVLVTGHANADFDCLAAIVAASKLYENPVLVFPGSQESNLRNFFIESATYLFNFKDAKDIDFSTVKTLVIVDTRQRSRTTHVAPALENPDLEIHLYDHHPDSDDDLPATHSVVKPWGSTATIITLLIKEKDLAVSSEEATMFGLGIYEDTGAFTFSSTTEYDFEAAGWLKSKGMDLNTISELTTRDLTVEQISILNSLLESATTHEINGIPVVIAETSVSHYVRDFALLAHKMIDMQQVKVLFALCRMNDRVQVVARSKIHSVNVGQVCQSLGGGGHNFAASASVKNKPLSEVKDELFGLLYSSIHHEKTVREHMTAPAISEYETVSICHAESIMNRFGLKAIPLLESEENPVVSGYLEYQTAVRACSHGLGDAPVSTYMTRKFQTVEPEDDLYPVMEIIVGKRQRLVPVVMGTRLMGVITRTDLINTLVEEPSRVPDKLFTDKTKERNVRTLLKERLPEHHFELLTMAGELGNRLNVAVYVVGGFVRDLLLGRKNLDLDLVVEGDGIAFAYKLAHQLGGRVRQHKKFKTAIIIYINAAGEEERLDVATARLEYYEQPASLPTVELSSIKMDLYRRDFTINALAIQLSHDNFGKLIDFFGAQKDIRDKLIRVLHSLSFVEDPTRILRAIRFETRFEFTIGPQTTKLIKNALHLKLITKLSGTRIFHELQLIFNEVSPYQSLLRMQEFAVLEAIHPSLKLTPAKSHLLKEIEKVLEWYRMLYTKPYPEAWIIYLLGLTSASKQEEVESVLERLHLTASQHNEFMTLRSTVKSTINLLGKIRPEAFSQLYKMLSPIPLEGVLYMMARTKSETVKKNISHYLAYLRNTTLDISGEDLQLLGFPPGPAYGEVLRKTLFAKLDDKVNTRQEQLDFAYRMLKARQ